MIYNRGKHLPEGKGQLLFLWLYQISYSKSCTAQEASLQIKAERKDNISIHFLVVTFRLTLESSFDAWKNIAFQYNSLTLYPLEIFLCICSMTISKMLKTLVLWAGTFLFSIKNSRTTWGNNRSWDVQLQENFHSVQVFAFCIYFFLFF